MGVNIDLERERRAWAGEDLLTKERDKLFKRDSSSKYDGVNNRCTMDRQFSGMKNLPWTY
jgi:hypothetical protein